MYVFITKIYKHNITWIGHSSDPTSFGTLSSFIDESLLGYPPDRLTSGTQPPEI